MEGTSKTCLPLLISAVAGSANKKTIRTIYNAVSPSKQQTPIYRPALAATDSLSWGGFGLMAAVPHLPSFSDTGVTTEASLPGY